MKKRDLVLSLALAALATATLLFGVIGAASSDGAAHGRIGSSRYGFSAEVPAGWHRSYRRLVPHLLEPREILSLGTFPMPVGGGGNCDREPIAAIERMRPGDALVSVQEYAPTGASAGAPPSLAQLRAELRERPEKIGLREQPHPRGERIPADAALWMAKLSFADHGRRFDALVYVKGYPRPARIDQVRSVLDGLRFQPGSWRRFHGREWADLRISP